MNNSKRSDQSNAPSLCVIGHVGIDEVIAPDGVCDVHIGGAAYATAVGAALVSSQVGIVSRAGTDFPSATALADSIDHYRVSRISDGRTSRFFLDYLQPDVTRGFRGDLGVGAQITDDDIPEYWRIKSWIYVSTMPPAQQHLILHSLRNQGCSNLSADLLEAYVCAQPALSLAVAKLVDILFVNEFEWAILRSIKFQRDSDSVTVVKRGARGAAVYLGEDLLFEGRSYARNAIDPTNAGDVFAGAFLARLIQTGSYEAALSVALEAGARCVEVRSTDALLKVGEQEILPDRSVIRVTNDVP